MMDKNSSQQIMDVAYNYMINWIITIAKYPTIICVPNLMQVLVGFHLILFSIIIPGKEQTIKT